MWLKAVGVKGDFLQTIPTFDLSKHLQVEDDSNLNKGKEEW